MDRCSNSGGSTQRRERDTRERVEKDQGARKGRKVAKHVFPMFCGSGRSKSRLANAAGSERLWSVAMLKKCTPLWREAHSDVKRRKIPRVWSTFGRSTVTFLAGARDSAPCQKWAKREGFVAVAKTMACVGRLKRICTTLHYTPLHFPTLRYSTTAATAATTRLH